MSGLQTQTGLEELKTRLRDTWMTGDYGRFARYLEPDAEVFYRRLSIKSGRGVARCCLRRRGAAIANCGEGGRACDRVRPLDQLAGPSPSKCSSGGANRCVRRRGCGSSPIR